MDADDTRSSDDLPRRLRIVVGVDGSPGSRAALGYAMETAGRRGADLDVVPATDAERLPTNVVLSPEPAAADLLRRSHDRDLLVVGRRGEGCCPQRPARLGGPALRHPRVLSGGRRAPDGGELGGRAPGRGVGSRGRGAVRALLLGSVALHGAMNAPGPVMVVHPARGRSATIRQAAGDARR